MQVISMTRGKIVQDYLNGQEIIVKRSTFDEVKKIEEARNILKKHKIFIGEVLFDFHLPKIYDYRDGKIYMEFLTGDNLELELRTPKHHGTAANITNSLFQYFYDNQLYWGDFAPRNIIIDSENKMINLCDFERGISAHTSKKEYLQNYVYEEYAAFLFPSERHFSESLNNIFLVDKPQPIELTDIHSNRVKSIVKEQNISEHNLTTQTVANINKMIVLAETPYKKNGEDVFPIVKLEQIKDNSYELFAKEICNILANKGHLYGNSGRI